jgi:hypothetical protein
LIEVGLVEIIWWFGLLATVYCLAADLFGGVSKESPEEQTGRNPRNRSQELRDQGRVSAGKLPSDSNG